MNALFLKRWALLIGCLLFGPTGLLPAADATATLTLNATVLLPDGKPAVAAVIQARAYTNVGYENAEATTDADGHVTFTDPFLCGLRLHIRSADGRHQATVLVPEAEVRRYVSEPKTFRLKPAIPHEVFVVADSQPVEGAIARIGDSTFESSGVTDSDGTATLWCPDKVEVDRAVAWHPRLGVDGFHRDEPVGKGNPIRLSLRKPRGHTVRILDDAGDPVVGEVVRASVHVRGEGWLRAGQIETARAITDKNGEAVFDWFPAEGLKRIEAYFEDREWKLDKTSMEKVSNGLTVVHVRRRYPISGRVVVSDAAGDFTGAGLLLTGHAFGVTNNGDIPRARTGKNGEFTMLVPAGHGFVFGVTDRRWATDPWTGSILPVAGQPQAKVELAAYPATPLQVRVTRGASRQPVEEAWIHYAQRGRVEWTTPTGESRSGRAGVGSWMLTDHDGDARTGVGRGEVNVRLSAGDWREEKTINVSSAEPIQVEFHRAWIGDRIVSAQPTIDGSTYQPTESAVALAWTEREPIVDKIHEVEITDEGKVEVRFDEENLALLLLDPAEQLSGFARFGPDDTTAELYMQPNASLTGQLLDRHDDTPLANYTVRMITDSSFLEVVDPVETDDAGQFRFAGLPSEVPLRIDIDVQPDQERFFLFDCERLFAPGENRSADLARAALMDGHRAVRRDRPVLTLAERVASMVENARVMNLGAIAILKGDESENVTYVAGRLRNGDETPAMLRCMRTIISAEQAAGDADFLAEMDWTAPASGTIGLYALSHDRQTVASITLDCSDIDDAAERGSEFLAEHAPPMVDGHQRLDEVLDEAKRTDRSVWLICGGPRCGPCVRLARWIDRHHELLEQDLVIVKLNGGTDQHTHEIQDEIGGDQCGIPFHAMLAPDGTVLITSDGPLGNIGFPGSVEGARHLASMLKSIQQNLTSAEIDQLTVSLNSKD